MKKLAVTAVAVGAMGVSAGVAQAADAPALTWTPRASVPITYLQDVAYGNGRFVAVGADKTAAYSDDGVKWTAVTSQSSANRGIAFGNGVFVAVGYSTGNSPVETSTDGVTWTARTAPSPSAGWGSVAYGNGKFVAVTGHNGEDPTVMTSPDGVTWTVQTQIPVGPHPDGISWTDVTFGNGRFVAHGKGWKDAEQSGSMSIFMVSSDGVTWTASEYLPYDEIRGIAHGAGLFVAVGQKDSGTGLMTSPDGTTWTPRTSPGQRFPDWNDVVFADGRFVAVSGGDGNNLMTSADGINWALGDSPVFAGSTYTNQGEGFWGRIVAGGGKFVAFDESGFSTAPFSSTGPIPGNAGLSPGKGLATLDGAKVPVTVTKSGQTITMTGSGFKMSLIGYDDEKNTNQLDSQGRLILQAGGYTRVAGDGFAPNSDVQVYLFSTPVLLGTVKTDAKGGFSQLLPIPASTPSGEHTIQANGYSNDGKFRSLNLGVIIPAEGSGVLPQTGASANLLALLSMCLFLSGAAMVAVRRRII